MQVMKFADRRDAAERHFKERHARGIVNVLGRESCGRAVHHLAPGPKTVFVVAGAIFGASANHALKGVRVSVDETGQGRAVRVLGGPPFCTVRKIQVIGNLRVVSNLMVRKGECPSNIPRGQHFSGCSSIAIATDASWSIKKAQRETQLAIELNNSVCRLV
jgi:hypothetical protein